MATIILGHGGFDPAGGSIGETLIPPGIVFNTYSDAGEYLMVPVDENNDFDYSDLAKGWDHFTPYASQTEKMPTYCFTLGALEPEEIRLANGLDWGGAVVLCVGDAIPDGFLVCTGTADTCPTPQLLTQEEGSVPEEKWLHDCDGILGSWGRQTDGDIHWIACTGISGLKKETGMGNAERDL